MPAIDILAPQRDDFSTHTTKGTHMKLILPTFLAAFLIFTTGCASYTAPGGPANMRELGATEEMKQISGDAVINQEFNKKPLASFPAAIAAVHVQDGDYQSYTYHRSTDKPAGRFTVITKREAESDDVMDRLQKMTMVAGVAPMNQMLFNGPVNSEKDIRLAAAKLQADMVLIYTFETKFYVKDFSTPVSIISLGLSPNQQARVSTTASAILMDTRSGYIYGLAESTAESKQLTNAWQSSDAIDDTRRQTEKESFTNLVGELEKTWPNVVKQYAKPAAKG